MRVVTSRDGEMIGTWKEVWDQRRRNGALSHRLASDKSQKQPIISHAGGRMVAGDGGREMIGTGKEVQKQAGKGGGEVGEEGGGQRSGRRGAAKWTKRGDRAKGSNLGVRCPCPGSEQSGRGPCRDIGGPVPLFLSALAFFQFYF